MKKTRIFILLTGVILVLLALRWSRGQIPSHPLKVVVDGVEVHTLMSDQHNALVGHLEAAGRTNALEMLRQYRCAYGADLASSELEDTLAVLQYLRQGQTSQAIQRLEQHLGRYANLMCNSYGCLSATNRERVRLEPVEKTVDYYARFPSREERAELEAMKSILKSKGEASR